MKGYDFHEKLNTDEIHIFEGTITAVSQGTLTGNTSDTSICQKAKKSGARKIFTRIATTYEARQGAAGRGNSVCGVCASHFYKTPS